MSVLISRVRLAVHRPGHGWIRGLVAARVDGHTLLTYDADEWRCGCSPGRPADCLHIAQVIALIDPATLDGIRERRRECEPRPLRDRRRNNRTHRPAHDQATQQQETDT